MILEHLIKGSELNEADKRHVLGAYVHRYTKDHRPFWVKDDKKTPVQFGSDADWLEHTKFWVKKDGRLDARYNHCNSEPTWPNNPELRV